MRKIAENVWLCRHPLKVFGADIIRNVTIIRLATGKLVIHSTAQFSPKDIEMIRSLGEPAWILDAMLDHDTFSEAGRTAFPGIPFLAPPGFEKRVNFSVTPLLPAPGEWQDEISVLPIKGASEFGEHVILHIPSRTLIVCDLVFNYESAPSIWTKLLLYPALGAHHAPGVSKRFLGAIDDRTAFRNSLQELFEWKFDRVIPGHGQVLEKNAKSRAHGLLRRHGLVE